MFSLLVPSNGIAATTYQIQDLGTGWQPTGINDHGLILGNMFLGGGQSQIVQWQGGCSANCLQNLGTLGGTSAYASGINNFGALTGFTQNGSSLNTAFIYRNNVRTDLGTLGGNQSQGYAINDLGQVAGSSNTSLGYDSAFVYGAGNIQDIGTGTATVGVPAWLGQNNFLTPSIALGINNQGQVVGNTHLLGGTGFMSAFVYDSTSSNPYSIISPLASQSAGSRYLGEPTARIFATDINDSGQVVGTTFDDAIRDYRGFVFQNGVFADLAENVDQAFAINNSGQILGFSNAGPTTGMVLVENGIVSSWVELIGEGTGWSLSTGTGNMSLNNAGQIVGIGYLDGEQHTFLMTPNQSPPSSDAQAATSAQLARMAEGTYNGVEEPIGSVGQSDPIVGGTFGKKPSSFLDTNGSPSEGTFAYAESYVSRGVNGGRDQIVIAIRGSYFREDFELRNGSFLGEGATDGFKDAAKDIAGLIAQLRADHPEFADADFTLTGHSMGGALAQALAEVLHLDAVGFNAPGARSLLNGIGDELRGIAQGNLDSAAFSQDSSLKTIRAYGDQVSKIGDAYSGLYSDISTVFSDGLDSTAARIAIDLANAAGGLCAYQCHRIDHLRQALEEGRLLEPGITDSVKTHDLPILGDLDAAAAFKRFILRVDPNRIFGLDPNGIGDVIEISMLDSDADLSGIVLPSPKDDFPVWFFANGQWTQLGVFGGYAEFAVPAADFYRIGHAGFLQDETGRFAIGLRFASEGTFRGSIGLVQSGIPEPTSWVLMIAGFGLTGAAMRRRQSVRVTYA